MCSVSRELIDMRFNYSWNRCLLRLVWIALSGAVFIRLYWMQNVLLPSRSSLRRWTAIRWVGDDSLPVDDDRIFFHETSGASDLNWRFSCAVESAALHNPNRSVHLFFSADRFDHASPWLSSLAGYPNVQVIMIGDGQAYFDGSPLDDWYRQGVWKTSDLKVQHMSDYIRLLSLSKGGGMYMDLDIITQRPYVGDEFVNFFAFERPRANIVANSVMHLRKGHRMIDELLRRAAERYSPHEYIANGPLLVTNLLADRCNVSASQPKTNRCPDFHVLPFNTFYPLGMDSWPELFQAYDRDRPQLLANITGAPGVHIAYSSQTAFMQIDLQSDQVYAHLARRNCPLTVEMAVVLG